MHPLCWSPMIRKLFACGLNSATKGCTSETMNSSYAFGQINRVLIIWNQWQRHVQYQHHWCSGNISSFQALAPGSIPGWCSVLFLSFCFVDYQMLILITRYLLLEIYTLRRSKSQNIFAWLAYNIHIQNLFALFLAFDAFCSLIGNSIAMLAFLTISKPGSAREGWIFLLRFACRTRTL